MTEADDIRAAARARLKARNDFKIMLAARTVARALTEAAQQRKA